MNPVLENSGPNSPQGGAQEENLDQFDDEEEMLEMMAMQEECRMEMMKFYIQSQNPGLFEEVYHGVSYPDQESSSSANATSQQEQHQQQHQQQQNQQQQYQQQQNQQQQHQQQQNQLQQQQQPSSSDRNAFQDRNQTSEVKNYVLNNLTTEAQEFDPSILNNLNLNQ